MAISTPTNITGKLNDNNAIIFTWEDSSDEARNCIIQRKKTSESDYAIIGVINIREPFLTAGLYTFVDNSVDILNYEYDYKFNLVSA